MDDRLAIPSGGSTSENMLIIGDLGGGSALPGAEIVVGNQWPQSARHAQRFV
jgi:hypothetical protein